MKKAVKKLALTRETLRALGSASLQNVGVGVAGTSEGSWCATCESCTGICCTTATTAGTSTTLTA
jgi:hypothetical protein